MTENEAEDLVTSYYEAIRAAASALDPDHPMLRRTMTGEAFEFWTARVQWLLDNDAEVQLNLDGDPFAFISTRITGSSVLVVRCTTDATKVVEESTGAVINDEVVSVIRQHRIVETDDGPRVEEVRDMREVESC